MSRKWDNDMYLDRRSNSLTRGRAASTTVPGQPSQQAMVYALQTQGWSKLFVMLYYAGALASYSALGDIMPANPFDNYLDLVEAARILRIHPQSLRRLIKQKKVPAILFAGKYLIERDKLEMFQANYDPRPGRKPIRRLL